MLAQFTFLASQILRIKRDPVNALVCKTEKSFLARLKEMEDVECGYLAGKKRQERKQELRTSSFLINPAIDDRYDFYKSRNIALEDALKGSPELPGAAIFFRHTLDTANLPALFEHIDRLISGFAHARDLPNAAAQYLYARIYKIDDRNASRILRDYLRCFQKTHDAKNAMCLALRDLATTLEGQKLAGFYHLKEISNSALSGTVAQDQHIGWLHNLEEALKAMQVAIKKGGRIECMNGKEVGRIAGAINDDMPARRIGSNHAAVEHLAA